MRLRLGFTIEDVFRIHNVNPFLTNLLLQEVESTDHHADAILISPPGGIAKAIRMEGQIFNS
jgi:hypothetical protein